MTALNEKGIPTPLVHTMMRAPESRMDVLSPKEIDELVSNSEIAAYYNEEINRESAAEILTKKIEEAEAAQAEEMEEKAPPQDSSRSRRTGCCFY